ncbi:hypothetical protein DIPPA_03209 [Diplonema papillatum]|nr:hypothetical protein DIPPA_03209 [Diplonema papillatum]
MVEREEKWCRYVIERCCVFKDCVFRHMEDFIVDASLDVPNVESKDKKAMRTHVMKAFEHMTAHAEGIAHKLWIYNVLGLASFNVRDDEAAKEAIRLLMDEFQAHAQQMRHWDTFRAVFTYLYPFFDAPAKTRSGTRTDRSIPPLPPLLHPS